MVTREEHRFVEEMGALFEQVGSSRMAGRVWAYLVIADTEQVSSLELVDSLEASPSSISGAVRLLESDGMIDRMRVPGDRKDYYTIHHGAMLSLVRRPIDAVARMHDLASRGLSIFRDRDVARPHLVELTELSSWFTRELGSLVLRFQAEAEPGSSER